MVVETSPHGLWLLADLQLELTLAQVLLLSVSETQQFPVYVVKPDLSIPCTLGTLGTRHLLTTTM